MMRSGISWHFKRYHTVGLFVGQECRNAFCMLCDRADVAEYFTMNIEATGGKLCKKKLTLCDTVSHSCPEVHEQRC